MAIRAASARGIDVRLIDLPYPEYLYHSLAGAEQRDGDAHKVYNDDYLLTRSRFINDLCARPGIR